MLNWFSNLFNTNNNTKKRNILFVGDSITAAPNFSYPYLIKNRRKDLSIDVLAKSGQTTTWMLSNLKSYLFTSPKKYEKIYIFGGVNDAFNGLKYETTTQNLQNMINLIKLNGAKPYVMLGIEPNGYMDYRKMPVTKWVKSKNAYIPLIERYKKLQSEILLKVKEATLIPKFNLQPIHTQDGTHPTAQGQLLISNLVEKTI
jgi:lysophospholipase L1-like esterase